MQFVWKKLSQSHCWLNTKGVRCMYKAESISIILVLSLFAKVTLARHLLLQWQLSGLWAILLYLENICNLFSGIGNRAMAFLTGLVWTSVGDYILPLWTTLFALPKAFTRLGQLRRFPQLYIHHSFQNAGFTPVPSSIKPLNLQWSAFVDVL